MDPSVLCLSLILMSSASVSGSWKMTVSSEVTASRGEDAVLRCSISPNRQDYSQAITVKWAARDATTDPFFRCSVRNDSVEREHGCSASVLQYSLFGDPRRGELSLFISNVQLTNAGDFFCKVQLDGQELQKKVNLRVTAKPQILSLSVRNETCGERSSASLWLKCEVEGNPLPKVVWLSPSKRLLEDQGKGFNSGQWRWTACVPYLQEEDQVITCRAENSEGHAERSFPESNGLRMTVILLTVTVLMFLSAVFIFIICLTVQVNSVRSTKHSGDTEVTYSSVKV